MMSDESSRVVASVLLPVAVGGVFTIARATGHLDWSWFWVLCPIWGVGLYLALCMLGGMVAAYLEREK